MSTLLVIPARHASTRYPGKPLAPLRGATGEAKSLLRRSWEAACEVQGIDRVVVATEDERIQTHAMGFGAEVVMTSDRHRNGTERCAEVLDALGGVDITAYEKVYPVVLAGADGVLEWVRGTALVPYLSRLSERDGVRFVDAYRARLRARWPEPRLYYAFTRVLFTARKPVTDIQT